MNKILLRKLLKKKLIKSIFRNFSKVRFLKNLLTIKSHSLQSDNPVDCIEGPWFLRVEPGCIFVQNL